MTKKIKKPTIVKDYKPMIINYLHDSLSNRYVNYDRIITKKNCYNLNYISRNKNISNFNSILHESIIYFIEKKHK